MRRRKFPRPVQSSSRSPFAAMRCRWRGSRRWSRRCASCVACRRRPIAWSLCWRGLRRWRSMMMMRRSPIGARPLHLRSRSLCSNARIAPRPQLLRSAASCHLRRRKSRRSIATRGYGLRMARTAQRSLRRFALRCLRATAIAAQRRVVALRGSWKCITSRRDHGVAPTGPRTSPRCATGATGLRTNVRLPWSRPVLAVYQRTDAGLSCGQVREPAAEHPVEDRLSS